MQVYLQNPPDHPDRRPGHQEPLPVLHAVARQAGAVRGRARSCEAEIAKLPEVEDVTSDLAITSPQVNVNIDRDKAAALQVNANAIENAFYDAYGPRWVSTIYAPINEYKVLLELEPQYQADPHALSLLYFKVDQRPAGAARHAGQAAAGHRAADHQPLRAAARRHHLVRPEARRVAGRRGVEGAGSRRPDACPPTVTTNFQGAAKAFQSSLGNLWVLLIVAILVVYIVLGILYESYIHPLTILSGLPSAGFGALVTLLAVPHGPEHLRVRRADHADRHREEERDHADRLRARSRAQPGHDAA